VAGLDARTTGIASVIIGVGRSKKEDTVLASAGITLTRTVGDPVRRGEELCVVHGESEPSVDEACRLMAAAYRIAPERIAPGPRLLEEITRA
jgi:pyrimidine-nucleoside phosphorylase